MLAPWRTSQASQCTWQSSTSLTQTPPCAGALAATSLCAPPLAPGCLSRQRCATSPRSPGRACQWCLPRPCSTPCCPAWQAAATRCWLRAPTAPSMTGWLLPARPCACSRPTPWGTSARSACQSWWLPWAAALWSRCPMAMQGRACTPSPAPASWQPSWQRPTAMTSSLCSSWWGGACGALGAAQPLPAQRAAAVQQQQQQQWRRPTTWAQCPAPRATRTSLTCA